MPTSPLPALSYVCTGRVTVGPYTITNFYDYSLPATFEGQRQQSRNQTFFDQELKPGQTVSWSGSDGIIYSAQVAYTSGPGIVALNRSTFGAEQVSGVTLTAYYDSDVYTAVPMAAADCKVLNLWNGTDNGDANAFNASGFDFTNPLLRQSGPNIYWYDRDFNDSTWTPAVAVEPDPTWSDGVPLLSGSDYIWDAQKDNPVNEDDPADSTNDAEQMAIRWKFTLSDVSHTTDGNALYIAGGSRARPLRSPPCVLGSTGFVRGGNSGVWVNGQPLVVQDSPGAFLPNPWPWYVMLYPGPNVIAFMVNDARFLSLPNRECPGAPPWQPWISVPWFGSGLLLHGFSLTESHRMTILGYATFGAAASTSGARSFAQVVG